MLTVAIGYLLEQRRPMEVRALAAIAIYVLLPALIFSSLLTTKLTWSEALPVVCVVLSLLIAFVNWTSVFHCLRLRRIAWLFWVWTSMACSSQS